MDVSRYLSAAAYLDEWFREDVLSQAFENKHRFLGPSYGVDVASVVRHCLESQRMTRRRDRILAGLLLVAVTTLPLIVLRGIVAWMTTLPLIVLLGIVAWAIVFVDEYRRRYVIVAGQLRQGSLASMPDPKGMDRRYPGYRKRLAELGDDRNSNVVVYSGYSPFVGSGARLGAWSFEVNVQRAAKSPGRSAGSPPVPFRTTEIHDYVMKAMSELRLDGLTVTDRLFVDGQNVWGNPRLVEKHDNGGSRSVLLEDRYARPRSRVDNELIRGFISDPTTSIREYLDIKVPVWRDELILSAFARFWQVGEYLFMEVSFYLLPPLKGYYHSVDNLNSKATARQRWHLVIDSLRETPHLWLGSPSRLGRWLFAPYVTQRREREVTRAIRENRAFDYGAYTSIRESGSARDYQTYFQVIDKERSYKIVERHLLDAVLTFLEEKGVDTSEFKQQIQVLYNSGIIVGNSLNADSVAFGEQAQAFSQRVAGAGNSGKPPSGPAAPSDGEA